MKRTDSYSIEVATRLGFDDAIRRVTELLAEQGFGVLTEIDVRATLKKRLDLEFKPYTILGACNPTFAHRALQAEPHVGVLLPCNVVVWDEGDHRVVAAMEPLIMGEVVHNDAIRSIAVEVSARIRTALEGIGHSA